MVPTLQTVNQIAQTIGWGIIISFIAWAWRLTVLIKTNHEKSQTAMEQIDKMSTNHFPHMEEGIADLNKKTDEGNKTLGQIATGIEILVDRGRR